MEKQREIPAGKIGAVALSDPPATILLILLIVLTLVWIGGIATSWGAIAARPERLATLVADVSAVIVPGFAAVFLVWRGGPRAHLWYVLALGTYLYAVVHNVAYLLWDNYFGVPLAVAVALTVVFAGYVIYAVRAIRIGDG